MKNYCYAIIITLNYEDQIVSHYVHHIQSILEPYKLFLVDFIFRIFTFKATTHWKVQLYQY